MTSKVERGASMGRAAPGPAVRPNLATPASLAAPDEHATARVVKIVFGQRQRFVDP
jgi:hypothetical protein